MKFKIDKILIKKIILFISFTVFMLTLYYKIYPNIKKYGMEVFEETDYTKTEEFQNAYIREIQFLEDCIYGGIKLQAINKDYFSAFDNKISNTEYILDIKLTNGEEMLLSNITDSEEELRNLINNFRNSKRYYICKLNEYPETNQKFLERYQFHADQRVFEKLDVYIRIDTLDKSDHISSLKKSYDDFINNKNLIILTFVVTFLISVILLINLSKDIKLSKKNRYFDNLYIEEIIVLIITTISIVIRIFMGNNYTAYLYKIFRVILYILLYYLITEMYFSIIRVKKKRKFLIPKMLENAKYIYKTISIYIIVIVINLAMINTLTNLWGYIREYGFEDIIFIYTIIFLHIMNIQIELIEISRKVKYISRQGEQQIIARNKELEELANNINNVGQDMKNIVREKLKSERLKTELITNVSHDLKTPLTSIINYTNLLKKEKIENENAKKYIEILEDKSKKLKNLTEDLIEASKLSSGNETVNLQQIDFKELVLQANGEFAEKFEEKNLQIISNLPEESIIYNLDNKKMWRVLENLYQNVYKYSLENTRVYVDLMKENDKIIFMIKNISKEKLNISPEELMERFVQGDKSRNSSGNGLGLSISKDLVALNGGVLKIEIEGDLFVAKIILIKYYF